MPAARWVAGFLDIKIMNIWRKILQNGLQHKKNVL
jgi:hypothetical protein